MFTKSKNLFKLVIFFSFGIVLLTTCEKEIYIEKETTPALKIVPTIKTVAYNKTGEVFNRLKDNFELQTFLKSKKEAKLHAKTTKDTLGVTIYTDEIKEIILGSYTSYTMRITKSNPNTSAKSTTDTFYNLTIEDKNGVSNMFVNKYVPSQSWLADTNNPYQGNTERMSLDDFVEAGSDDIDGETNDSGGFGGGGSSGSGSSQGSPYYPTNCNGWVIVSIVDVAYQCSCEDHWPWQKNCTCGNMGSGTPPGYHQIPYYTCQPYNNNDNTNTGNTTNTTNTGGGGTSSGDGGGSVNPDDTSITVVLPNGEECKLDPTIKEYDLNNDCQLEAYEVCMPDLNYKLFSRLNDSDKKDVIDFINLNGCGETQQQQFINLAIEALLNDSEVDFEDKIILDETFVNNQRLKCVYDKFKAGENKISKYLENFLGEKPVAHLKFKADDNFSNTQLPKYHTAGAITSEPDNYIINITFNTDSSLDASAENFPTIILATELIHEMVHAEMFRKLLSFAQEPNIPWTRDFILGLRNDFEGLSDYYTRYWLDLPPNSSPTSAQHQAMANHYRNMVKEAIKDFDNNQNADEVYNALSWIGLTNTEAFNDPSIDQATINNIITNTIANDTKNCSN